MQKETMKRNVIFDHDGGVDDLLSLMLLLTMEHINLIAVTITPADCYLSDAIKSTLKILSLFGRTDVPVAGGQYYGVNSFPADWRAQPKICNALPQMLTQAVNDTQLVDVPAHHFIAQTLLKHSQVTVLMTGPCSHLVMAIQHQPACKAQIEEVIWMGGAVHVQGNVAMHNHDKSAEWNAFWDPQATANLFASNLPIKLICLDATNHLPVDLEFLTQLAKKRHFPIADLAGQFWATTINSIPSYEYRYFMWDVLATSVLGVPSKTITFTATQLAVSCTEPNAGQTYPCQNSGQWIDVATGVDRQVVLDYVLAQFCR